jgi:GTP cyclohydrolase II
MNILNNMPDYSSCHLIRTGSRMIISSHFEDQIQLLRLGDLSAVERPLIRLHSSCQFSETFGAVDCDCAGQLRAALSEIEAHGCGAVLYLQQEGRGHGLGNKLRIVGKEQQDQLTTYESCDALGLSADARCYHEASELLRSLGVERLCLLTNNPTKVEALKAQGFDVTTKPVRGTMTTENRAYLASKSEYRHRDLLIERRHLDNVTHDWENPVVIGSTNGPFGEMSNFSKHPVFEDGVIWPTSEHLYQSRKFDSSEVRDAIRRASGPADAKARARAHRDQIIDDWEALQLTFMYSTVKLKLSQNPEVKMALLGTKDREIVEHSEDDAFWGRNSDGQGNNYFGKTLMFLRDEMRSEV